MFEKIQKTLINELGWSHYGRFKNRFLAQAIRLFWNKREGPDHAYGNFTVKEKRRFASDCPNEGRTQSIHYARCTQQRVFRKGLLHLRRLQTYRLNGIYGE